MHDAAIPEETTDSVRKVLEFLNSSNAAKLHELTPDAARALFAQMAPALDMPQPEVARAESLAIPGPAGEIPARAYWPREGGEAPLKTVVFYHGGGFVLGDTAIYDRLTRYLANAADALVISVDYRLAPEHPFPASVEDAQAAFAWAAKAVPDLGGDPARLVVAGDSAGGNLAAVTALTARAEGGSQPAAQLLFYPVVDMAGNYDSHKRYGSGLFLEHETMAYFLGHYLPENADPADWRVSPLRAADHSGLAPAYILLAGLDPLVDEGEAYANRLEAAGIPVTWMRYPGLIHGFLSMAGVIPEGRKALDDVGKWLQENT